MKLPNEIADLVIARNKLAGRFATYDMKFQFDGNLVGDLGEAIAAELFNLRPSKEVGVDAYAQDGRSVQVKATGTGRGANFRNTQIVADQLLFLSFNYDELEFEIVYYGPESKVRDELPMGFLGQRAVSLSRLRKLDEDVAEDSRLKI